MITNKCCGSCKHFKDEDAEGFGFCIADKYVHHITGGGLCVVHQFKNSGWTEITPDNVNEMDADLIVVTDGTYYKMANDWHASLSTLAKVGGYYFFVLPELMKEE